MYKAKHCWPGYMKNPVRVCVPLNKLGFSWFFLARDLES
jgi:hypothetical protein